MAMQNGLDAQTMIAAMQGGTGQRIQAAEVAGQNAMGVVSAGNASLQAGTQLKEAKIQAEAQKKAAMMGLAGSLAGTVAQTALGGINAATYAKQVNIAGQKTLLEASEHSMKMNQPGAYAEAFSKAKSTEDLTSEAARLPGPSEARSSMAADNFDAVQKNLRARLGIK